MKWWRWWPRRKDDRMPIAPEPGALPATDLDEARAARLAAERRLAAARDRDPAVRQVADRLRTGADLFAQELGQTFKERRP